MDFHSPWGVRTHPSHPPPYGPELTCKLIGINILHTKQPLKQRPNYSVLRKFKQSFIGIKTYPKYVKGNCSAFCSRKTSLNIEVISSRTSLSLQFEQMVAFPISPLSASSPLSLPLGQLIPTLNAATGMQITSLVTCRIRDDADGFFLPC